MPRLNLHWEVKMETEIKEGDTVRLKSGGPIMTVGPKMSGGVFLCQWFHNFEIKEQIFHPYQLKPSEPEQK